MARTLDSVVRERAPTFVGRDAELAFLRRLLEDDGPIVAFVFGAHADAVALLERLGVPPARARPINRVQAMLGEPVAPSARSRRSSRSGSPRWPMSRGSTASPTAATATTSARARSRVTGTPSSRS